MLQIREAMTRFRNAGPPRRTVEFKRLPGQGTVSQNWIDRNLPNCPLCKSPALWETAMAVDSMALERWYFRCASCNSVLSTPPDLTVSALAPPVTVTKTPIQRDIRVESVGRNADEDFVGEEFPLSELQEWAEESQG